MKKTLRSVILLVLALSMLLALTACSTSQKSDKVKIGVTLMDFSTEFGIGLKDYMTAKADAMGDVELTVVDAGGDAAKQLQQVETFISQKVDAIIMQPQEQEACSPAIDKAKAAGIPIIVAINKMDKPEANPERIKQQLTEYGLVCEEWGGDTIVCPISAKTGMGVDNLLEMLTLTAEVGELKANPNRAAQGTVIEARLDKGRGPVATLLVQNGTLHQGDIIIAGTSVGRVRAMVSDKGQRITEAGPSVPVEITGLSEAPSAGATFNAVADEKLARELVEQRKAEEKAKANAPVTKVSLEDLFSQIQAGEMKNLNLIVKADVQGSVEAVNVANNHTLDYGQQGKEDTIANLEAAGIIVSGGGQLGIFEKNGVKVGMTGYCFPYNVTGNMTADSYKQFYARLTNRMIYTSNRTLNRADHLLTIATDSALHPGWKFVLVAAKDGEVRDVRDVQTPQYPQAYFDEKGKKNPYAPFNKWYPEIYVSNGEQTSRQNKKDYQTK